MIKYSGISGTFYSSISKSIIQSIEDRQVEIFGSLHAFVFERINVSYKVDDLENFSSFSNLLIQCYEYSVLKYRSSVDYQDIHENCAKSIVRGIKETIVFGLRFDKKRAAIEVKEKSNKFSNILLGKLSDIVYLLLKHKDFKNLDFLLNQINQVHSITNYEDYDSILEISKLKTDDLNEEQQVRLDSLLRFQTIDTNIDNAVRRIFKVIKYWIYYLYSNDILTIDDLKMINTVYEKYNGYIESNQLEDLYYLRSTSWNRENNWNVWDYKERPEMEVYNPPSVLQWITFGALIYFVENDSAIAYDINDKDPQHINDFEYLVSSMYDILNWMEKKGFDKWHTVLNTVSKEQFSQKIVSFRQQIDYLRNINISEKDRAIANQPLSGELIGKFKEVITKGWRKKNILRELFEHFNAIEVCNENDKLIQIGAINEIKEGWKKCFIEDKNFYVSIGNAELYGYELSKIEWKVFLREINSEIQEVMNVLSGIDNAIKEINESKFNASVILIDYNIWRLIFANLMHPDFILNWNKAKEFPFSEYGGFYKNIPIVPVLNGMNKGNVIIADFGESFALEQYSENDEPVTVGISQITEDEAGKILEANTRYWSYPNLTSEQAIIKIENAVFFNAYSYLKFKVRQSTAFIVLSAKTS